MQEYTTRHGLNWSTTNQDRYNDFNDKVAKLKKEFEDNEVEHTRIKTELTIKSKDLEDYSEQHSKTIVSLATFFSEQITINSKKRMRLNFIK